MIEVRVYYGLHYEIKTCSLFFIIFVNRYRVIEKRQKIEVKNYAKKLTCIFDGGVFIFDF